MKVIDQLRLWRADGMLNILINLNKYDPAILDYLEWWDFFEQEKANGNRTPRTTTCRQFKQCNFDKFDKLRAYFKQDIPEIDWIAKYKKKSF